MCAPGTAHGFQTEGGRIMDAKQVVTNYHNAWTSGDVEGARVYLAADLDFQGSMNTFHRADDFIAALAMFQKMLRGINLIQSFFSESGAALLYDCDTMSPAGVIRTAEFFTVADGKIQSIRLIFDATELRKLMG
jgi:ketosteroid isomerase-like protein